MGEQIYICVGPFYFHKTSGNNHFDSYWKAVCYRYLKELSDENGGTWNLSDCQGATIDSCFSEEEREKMGFNRFGVKTFEEERLKMVQYLRENEPNMEEDS